MKHSAKNRQESIWHTESIQNYNSINNNGRRITLWTGLMPGSHGSDVLCTLFTAILLFIYFSAFLYPVHGAGCNMFLGCSSICACVLGWRHLLPAGHQLVVFEIIYHHYFIIVLYALCMPYAFLPIFCRMFHVVVCLIRSLKLAK